MTRREIDTVEKQLHRDNVPEMVIGPIIKMLEDLSARQCLWPPCTERFIPNNGQLYCSTNCSDMMRTARFRDRVPTRPGVGLPQ
jgi:hypothetical protein